MYPQRKTSRLPHYDYSLPGMYFVTICSHERRHAFGTIDSGHLIANDAGQIVEQTWNSLPNRFPSLETDAFILMPNHLHGILFFYNLRSRPNPGGASPAPTAENPIAHAAESPFLARPSLGAVICAFKSISAIAINKLRGTPHCAVWQRNFFEHIIRTSKSLDQLRTYIRENPGRWPTDFDVPGLEALP